MSVSESTSNPNNNIISNSIGLHIALMSDTGIMHSLWLPYPPDGKYILSEHEDKAISEMLYFEAFDNKWIVNCIHPLHFRLSENKIAYSLELTDRCIFSIEVQNRRYILYAENTNRDSLIFHNYYADSNTDISIGRLPDNDIFYPNNRISKQHAIIRWENKRWHISDKLSSNGTYVNGIKIKDYYCNIGDSAYIMGLRIIFGLGFISINDGNNRIHIQSSRLHPAHPADTVTSHDVPSVPNTEPQMFNRLPRRRKALETESIAVESPPISLNSDSIPLLLRMGSPLVMSSTSLLAGNITSMLSSVLFPVLTQKYTEKQKKEYEQRRNLKYNEYLAKKRKEIVDEIIHEEYVLNHNYPELKQVISYADTKTRLWERRKNDDDFLSLRLGYGRIPMIAQCEYPDRSFYIDEDPLLEKMYHLVERPSYLEHVPIMTSFTEDNVCGVLGKRNLAIHFVRQLIMQLVLYHSYDEVKIIMLLNEDELSQLEFIKYLPHIWSDQKDFRFLATDTKDASQISEYLKREIGDFIEKPLDLNDYLKKHPYYFVFVFDKRIFDSMEILKDIIQSQKNCGVSVLTVFDDLPKECVKIFDLKESGEHSVIHIKQIEKSDDHFYFDPIESQSALRSMHKISNIHLKVLSQSHSLPKMISFLEMFNVGRVEHLNPLNRWHENNPVKSLSAPVGVDTEGNLFTLDLHEKYQGPHGLVAGMTGSGKSEFIITYILSMAVNYHPDEVAFILIDYKGGGLAGAFEDKTKGIHLPHLVGTITNLDGAAIQRSLMSIQSELKRRQHIFNEAKSHTSEGTMDIYTYQRLYRNRQVSEPLPHLFIISDEFAELKSQEPEFMDQLISAARIGRSLGVHLILATQKPAGVVNDQIWSNTKFRVCLKVQDRGDSYEMLKRPEAAELKDTGRFYLQVGYNEFFALGQSAWCGASYYPQDEVIVQKDDEILFVDHTGQPILKTRPKVERTDSGLKQLVAIVQYLSEIAQREGIESKPLWKEPLEKRIGVEKIISNYNIKTNKEIEVVLGLVDDPYHQKQFPLLLNLQTCRNYLIVGSSGSGKTTLVQTILYSLAHNYTSEQVNFYILDFSSRNLSLFRKLPHCGTVLMDDNEGEIEQLISILEDMLEQRKKLFSNAEVSSYDAYIKITPLPLIVLVIDNLSTFDEFKKGREFLDRLVLLMKTGTSYGIKVLATITNLNDCLYRMQHEFGDMLALQANDRYAYSNILNIHCKYDPPQIPGRGMCAIDGAGLEFQAALAIDHEEEHQRSVILREKLRIIAELNAGYNKALQIESAKEDQTFEEFCETFPKERLPLGYNLENGNKVAIPFQQLNSMSLYFGNSDGIRLILENLFFALQFNKMKILIVHKKENSIFDNTDFMQKIDKDNQFIHYQCETDSIEKLNSDLLSLFIERTPVRKSICSELNIGNSIEEWRAPDALKQWRKQLRLITQPVMVFFESMLDFQLSVNTDQVGKFKTNFTMARGYNVYYTGCFYAEDKRILEDITKELKEQTSSTSENREYSIEQPVEKESLQETRLREIRQTTDAFRESFNEDRFSLLFGGRFDCQDIISLPYEYRSITAPCKPGEYDKFLMHYRDLLVRMKMPVGEIETNVEDNDELSII